MPATEQPEASSRGWDTVDRGWVNHTFPSPGYETFAVVGFTEHREKSNNGRQETGHHVQLTDLPNEVLYEILSHLDVWDLYSASKVSSHFLVMICCRIKQIFKFFFQGFYLS